MATSSPDKPPDGVSPADHKELMALLEQWESDGAQIMTIADQALEVFQRLEWAFQRLLPNECVRLLARSREHAHSMQVLPYRGVL